MLRSFYPLLALLLIGTSGCAVVYTAGMPFVYDSAKLKDGESYLDLKYRDGNTEFVDPAKHTLDLYTPKEAGWPVLVFAHGGGWTSGDKDLSVGGKEVYRNIGRYFAERGVGTAVINYRLMPGVHWTTQIGDVASAVDWVYQNAPRYGGDTTRFYLSGHSAGAQLVVRVATDPAPLTLRGTSPGIVDGVIAVSGAGYDMVDSLTYAMGAEFEYLDRRFGVVDGSAEWPANASVVQFVNEQSPPMIFFVGSREHQSFTRQAEIMMQALHAHGVAADLHVVRGATHPLMVLRMSKDDNTLTEEALKFIRARAKTD